MSVSEVKGLAIPDYRGRFAPSPSGPLHFGSLVAALGSFLDAKSRHGKWFVRIEDIDPPRTVAGAAVDILRMLEAYQLYWDGEESYQSHHTEHYREIVEQLRQQRLCYLCVCTRKQIQAEGGIYSNRCRDKNHRDVIGSTRLRNIFPVLRFTDRRLGVVSFDPQRSAEDFVIYRRDGVFTYHLGMVVDDHRLGINHVVRGADLVAPTACQLSLYQTLGYQQPQHLHLPLALGDAVNKLSKHNHAPPIIATRARETLYQALRFLQQPLLPLSDYADVSSLLMWAQQHWDIALLSADDRILDNAMGNTTAHHKSHNL